MFKQSTKIMIAIIMMFVMPIATINAKLKLPEILFACHVYTVSDSDGIVLIQAYDAKDAINGAQSANALTIDGKTSRANLVKECIKRPNQKFNDYAIQQFYQNLPDEYK